MDDFRTFEELVPDAEARYRAIFNGVADVVFVVDRFNRYVAMNDLVSSYNANPQEIIGRTIFELQPAETAQRYAQLHRRVFETGEPTQIEMSFETDTGPRWQLLALNPVRDLSGTIVAVVGASRDITELRGTARELKQSEELFRSLVQTAGCMIVMLSTSARIIELNHEAERVYGLKRQDLIGQDSIELFVPPDMRDMARSMFASVVAGQSTSGVEFPITNVQGEVYDLIWNSTRIVNAAGDVVGVVSSAQDITDMRRAQRALADSEKMRSLGELAAGVAHTINNALTAILGYVQMLQRYPVDAKKTREGLSIIETTARDAARTVRSIQTFARERIPDEFQPVNMNDIVLLAIEMTRPRWQTDGAKSGVVYEMNNTLGDPTPWVRGNPSELRDIMVNLIINAIDAMPAGGRLCTSVRTTAGRTVVEVSDTGQGVPSEIRSRLFEPFFTTKGAKGTGLGLSISYGIIRRHSGEIFLRDTGGSGATFVIELPAIEELAKNPTQP